MPQRVTQYGVFISSPSDVPEQRIVVRDAIARWNDVNSVTERVVLQPLMWETAVEPTMDMTAQEAINAKLLSRADLLVAVLWSRLGTKTAHFESGTAEEIRSFPGDRQVYFYSRNPEFDTGHDVNEFTDQINRLKVFRTDMEAHGLVGSFSNNADLERLVDSNLTRWVANRQTVPEAVALLAYADAPPRILAEWNATGEPGIALLFNVELSTFKDWYSFKGTWGNIDEMTKITRVILVLPNYKVRRLFSLINTYKSDFLGHSGHQRFYTAEFLESSDTSGERSATGIGFAMFRFGKDPRVGETHPLAQVFVFSPPFSMARPDQSSDPDFVWDYRYALQIYENATITKPLEDLWNERFSPDRLRMVAAALSEQAADSTIQKEKDVERLIQSAPLDLDDPFETTLKLRPKLFDPNVPSYILDANYMLLDWNPAFELTFPTDQFYRGETVVQFLRCLTNYQEVLEKGKEFLDHVPLYHVEPFHYMSPIYGEMRFTKLTSPVTNQETGDFMGWNLALNVDYVEKLRLYAEHRAEATELDALISRYAGAYDRIMTIFGGYADLMRLHMGALGAATNILDVGAGPGILTERLLVDGKRVTATDNNDEMLQRLRRRCRQVTGTSRLKISKVNIEVLNGLKGDFDGATMLNVLFTLSRPRRCLEKVFKLLKPGSTLTVSGPRPAADIHAVFAAVEADLRRHRPDAEASLDMQVFRDVNLEFERKQMINRYNIEQTVTMLRECGFTVADSEIKDAVYAGQGVFIVARRP